MSSQWKDYEAIIDNFPDDGNDEGEADSAFTVSDDTFFIINYSENKSCVMSHFSSTLPP